MRGFMATWVRVAALSLLAQGAAPWGRQGGIGKRLCPSQVCRLLRGEAATLRSPRQNHSALENGAFEIFLPALQGRAGILKNASCVLRVAAAAWRGEGLYGGAVPAFAGGAPRRGLHDWIIN